MSEVFLKFKRRLTAFRIIRSVMLALSTGLVASGVCLALIRLAILSADPAVSAFVGIGAMIVGFTVCFLVTGRSDSYLAVELDTDFGLNDRVQTMVEFSGEDGEMLKLQRQDTELRLSEISLRKYKFKGFWIYATALLLSAAVLLVGFLVPDRRGYIPPTEVTPFSLSGTQERGLLELIDYVNNSDDIEDKFKTPIAEELTDLLDVLRDTHTEDDMIAAVIKSMAVISDITYRSSTTTELLTGLWNSGDVYLRHLARALAVSSWDNTDESGFGEEMVGYIAVLLGDNETDEDAIVGAPRVKAAVSGMNGKLPAALAASGLSAEDRLYSAIYGMFRDETYGLSLILADIDGLTDDQVRAIVGTDIDAAGGPLYAALMRNLNNASVGETVTEKLEYLFTVQDPKPERPDFYTHDWTVNVGQGSDGEDGDGEQSSGAGGAGGGVSYGSDDLVLDPLTGEIVKYGDIIKKYNERMYAMLESDLYTEEQKIAIRKYFELLYSGLEKKEG